MIPGRSSGRDHSSFATEWVITDGWLRAAITVRRTVSQARLRWLSMRRMLAPRSRCQIGAWFQTRMPARSRRESRSSLST